MVSIGEKIRHLRKKKGMTLDRLAIESRVSKAYLSQLENGDSDRPSAEILYNIALALSTSISNLLGKTTLTRSGETEIPRNLEQAALAFSIPKSYLNKLAQLSMRDGKREYSKEDWHYLYETLRRIEDS